jgi:hypothetical protein
MSCRSWPRSTTAPAYLTRTAAKRRGASLRVAHRVGDRGMAKEVLDQPSVRSLVGESVTRGMPQHVRMDMEPACPLDNAGDHVGRQWAATL